MSTHKAAVSNTFVGLQKTISWDIKSPYPGRGKVPIPEWMTFLQDDVGIELTDMENVMQHSITGALLVEMVSEEKFETFLRRAEQGVIWTKYNVMVNGWSAGEEVTMIHLHNVFTNSNLDEITKVMSKYGTIIAKEVHMYKQAPNLRNGVVTLKMKLRSQVELPTFIYEEQLGNTVEITSDRHQRTCWKCLGTGHIAAFCRKARQTQASASSTATWAKIVAKGPETTSEMVVEPEMVRVITPIPTVHEPVQGNIEPEKRKVSPVEPEIVEPVRVEPEIVEPGKQAQVQVAKPAAAEQRNRLDSGKWPKPDDTKNKKRGNWTKSPTEVDRVMKELEKKKQRISSST